MSSELVKRHIEQLRLTGGDLADLCQPIADAIDALTAERDRLRAALEDIADHDTGATAGLAYTAKIALKEKSNE